MPGMEKENGEEKYSTEGRRYQKIIEQVLVTGVSGSGQGAKSSYALATVEGKRETQLRRAKYFGSMEH